MSQHDFVIANQTANSARLDINAGLQALASNNSGDSEPPTTYANMWWYETDSNLLKIRNENDSAWINVAYVDQINNVYSVLDDTKLVNTSGAQTGLLGAQLQSAWLTGTSTTESLFSPAKLKAFGDALIDVNGLTSSNYLEVGGLYIQWKTGSFTAQENNIQYLTFPTTFPNGCLNCQIAMQLNVGASMDGSLYIRTTSASQVGFQFSHTNANNYGTGTVHILAIGH
jgi:hypothetical protein